YYLVYTCLLFLLFFFQSSGHPRLLPSFPTRRSSDLPASARAMAASSALSPPPTTHTVWPRWRAGSSSRLATLGRFSPGMPRVRRSEEHTSELQSRENLVCRLLLEKKKEQSKTHNTSN